MDHMTPEPQCSNVRVRVFDQEYSLRTTDPDFCLELAEYVDSRMREVAKEDENHMADSARLAVIVAMDLAEECFCLETVLDKFANEDTQRTRERRQRHYTKRTHEKRLLAVVNDESIPAKERLKALHDLGKSRGYHRAPKTKG